MRCASLSMARFSNQAAKPFWWSLAEHLRTANDAIEHRRIHGELCPLDPPKPAFVVARPEVLSGRHDLLGEPGGVEAPSPPGGHEHVEGKDRALPRRVEDRLVRLYRSGLGRAKRVIGGVVS